MKLIVWWLALLTILPLLYLGWWKKGWRLILGVTIVAILTASFFIPGEIISSLTRNEIAKEIRNKVKKIDELIHKAAATQETNSENLEKVEGAKAIIKFEEELKELDQIIKKEGPTSPDHQWKLLNLASRTFKVNELKNEWIVKWNKEISSSAILFCGEEFNQTLSTDKYKIEGREVNFLENVINFADYQDKNAEEIRQKLLEIIKKEEQAKGEFSIAFLKNINNISKQEVKELLLNLFGQGVDASSWKYKIDSQGNEQERTPNLSKFVFIANISNSDAKNLEELEKNFRVVEVPLSKYQLVIFILSGGVEVIIFFLLIRNKRKSQDEKLQQLD